MAIMLKRKDGSITPFRNAEFIPAYYFIPKSVLSQCGAELNSVSRNPKELLHSWDAIALVESDLFLLLIIDAYAFMVWPFWDWVQNEKFIPATSHHGYWRIALRIGFRKCRMKASSHKRKIYSEITVWMKCLNLYLKRKYRIFSIGLFRRQWLIII